MSSRLIRISLLVLLLCSVGLADDWKKGTLVSVTDSRSNRVITTQPSVVNVEDVEYRMSVDTGDGWVLTGSYWPRAAWSYVPTDMIVNDTIEYRVSGKHLFLKRPNGKALKTTIVQRAKAKAKN